MFEDFCVDRICPLFEGGTLLYRNGDHLSWKGAVKMKEEASDLLGYLQQPNQ